ncbi:MAG: transglutaminase family protein, partial [Planctomycetes bacterium]|nr:transglutaminase family protein [Planctomycetota bacterium]
PVGPRLAELLRTIDRSPRKTVDFLVQLNQSLQQQIRYVIRLEPGVQSCEETLQRAQGSCRDSGWLLVQILRHLGLAARFVSGYLIQLVADVKPLDGPEGPSTDFTDLHAWAEVYLPGAGWIGLDPTSGLLAGEGHIPLACTPDPGSAAPITGSVEFCETQFSYTMSVRRIHEDPRVTKPYTEQQWETILSVGARVDERLSAGDVRLTMGGEPTFVSIDDMQGDQWRTAALGEEKRLLADQLLRRLMDRFGPGGILQCGQGKWYPGESLPRWAFSGYWRGDGQPIWRNGQLLARLDADQGCTFDDAQDFTESLSERLGVDPGSVLPAYEDVGYYLWRENRLPVNIDPSDPKLKDPEERARLARVFQRGLDQPVGCVLPLEYQWWQSGPRWRTGAWPVRSEGLILIPGDSPVGLRLPMESLPARPATAYTVSQFPLDPLEPRPSLPQYPELWHFLSTSAVRGDAESPQVQDFQMQLRGDSQRSQRRPKKRSRTAAPPGTQPGDIVRTALCVEPRGGQLHVFLPPMDRSEAYLALIVAIEDTAAEMDTPVVLEGYSPPFDPRIHHLKVTPDPGVIEVNVHPSSNWHELVETTTVLYEQARLCRLGTEKFDLDGRHTGTGGGNHVLLGGRTPADSPFLRRPHLLRSFLAYWLPRRLFGPTRG